MSSTNLLDLHLDRITRVYPGVVALDKVSMHIQSGEVLGLIGENGAGKSTLMKILGGILPPTSGNISIDETSREQLSVAQSQQAGIAFVHQELNVFDNLDVAANIFLGREKVQGPLHLVNNRAMRDAVQPLLERVGAHFKPDTPVAELSLAEQQLLEIAKALSVEARLVIMDEPTSSLTLNETNTLLTVIAELKKQGIAVIFISHRLSEVQVCADRVVALRDGQLAGQLSRAEISHDEMIRLMIGRDLKSLYTPPTSPKSPLTQAPILEIRQAVTQAHPNSIASMQLHRGEILGIAGLVGSGRTELVQAIFGVDPLLAGEVFIDGVQLEHLTPYSAINAGLYLVPEDRKRSGLILEFGIVDNITLANLPMYTQYGLVSRKEQITAAEQQRKKLSIKTPDVRRNAQEMSGGNQQKVVLAKWLSMHPRVIIFDEPTRGIDVGSKSEIYKLMRALSDQGIGIMMISSDMEEVIGVSDRIVVMKEGQISGELERTGFSEHSVLALAVGKANEVS